MNTELELQAGNPLTVTVNDAYKEACDADFLWVDYKNIINVMEVGKKMYIDDGLISLIVEEKGEFEKQLYANEVLFVWFFLYFNCQL